ncbi:MAG: hypothetical protein KBC06_02195 [Candidatus Pacebacteria bacterium]|nr:hypothetical protein [Candidatus Paceibacterota bacterium]
MKINYFQNKIIGITCRITLVLFFTIVFVGNVYAADSYIPGDAITIGEFIYDDDYTPTTDDCTISIYSPAGATLVNEATMTDDATGWHYYAYTTPLVEGKYPTFITCGTLIGGDLMKLDKSFILKEPVVTDASIASSVWASGSRTLTSFGSLVTDIWSSGTRTVTSLSSVAADIWDNTFAPTRQLTTKNIAGGGSLATESYIDASEATVVTEVQANATLINSLNNISAADVWAHGTRSTNSGTVNIDSASVSSIWDKATSALSTSGSVGKLIVDNLDAQVSTRGTSNLTAGDVWANATRTLSTTGVDNITAGVWASAGRTLTSYGNDITAADVWNVLSASLVTAGSIGEQLSTNSDAKTSDVLASVAALNNISATDVWAAGTRSLTANVDISSASVSSIWDKATSALSTSGSVGKLIVDNLDAQVSTRGTSNLTAADVWAAGTRTLTDYATPAVATAVWANATRTLSNYGNDITAADVWNVLSSSLTTVGSIGEQLSLNVDGKITDVLSAISALNNVSAADVWAHGTRSINSGTVDLSTASQQAIWDVATSGLTTSGSIGKRVVDNLDAQVSTRGTSNLTAADVWASATRTLTDYSTSSVATAVWANATRTLSNYGNDITAADVWNVLSSSLTTVGSIGEQVATNVDGTISNVVTEIQTNRTLINSLNDISAADVWSYGTRSTNSGTVTLDSGSVDSIWNKATSGLTTAGSIGKRVVDNLDAQVSTRGTSTLTAGDVWANASRTLSDYSTSAVATAVWANATRTLTSYGNDITAADVWNVLSSTLTTVGSVGEQVANNLDATVSSRATAIGGSWAVKMGNVERVQTGQTYRTKVFIIDGSATPTAPFSTPTVTVYDVDRNVVVADVPMSLVSTGVYEYTYSVNSSAAQGLWEVVASSEVESGKIVKTNDYFEVAGSPAQVLINSVTATSTTSIVGNVTITNEGLTGYEYQYEWCVVTDVNNPCGGNDDAYYAMAAKFINPSEDWNTTLSASVSTAGTYYFKLVVYFGTESSGASRVFTVSAGGAGAGGGGGGGGGSVGITPAPAPIGGVCNGADFNKDQFVNSTDFSILLYFWKTSPPFKNPCVDINTDNKVDSVDFSIMLYQWGKKSI